MVPAILRPDRMKSRPIAASGRFLPSPQELVQIAVTFSLVLIAWVFFRSVSVDQAFRYLDLMFTKDLFSLPAIRPLYLLLLVFLFFLFEWMGREDQFALQSLGLTWKRPLRWSFYLLLSVGIFINLGRELTFIYFQF